MNKRAPLIGISTDVEVRPETRPPRPFYMLDETNARALIASGATPVLLPPEPECVEAYLELCDGLIVSGGGYQFQVPQLFRHDGTEPPEKERRFRFEAALLRGAAAAVARARERHPAVEWLLAARLGAEPEVAEALVARSAESLV